MDLFFCIPRAQQGHEQWADEALFSPLVIYLAKLEPRPYTSSSPPKLASSLPFCSHADLFPLAPVTGP